MEEDAVVYQDVDMELVEKIVNQIEESDFKRWEYSATKALSPDEQSLAQAQRFMAAQSFILSRQPGKAPTGWRRPRRLTDFEGESPPVLPGAKAVAQVRMEERNEDATKRINEKRSSGSVPDSRQDVKPISKKEIGDLKDAYSKFSTDLHDIASALSSASSTIANLVLRTQALEARFLSACGSIIYETKVDGYGSACRAAAKPYRYSG